MSYLPSFDPHLLDYGQSVGYKLSHEVASLLMRVSGHCTMIPALSCSHSPSVLNSAISVASRHV